MRRRWCCWPASSSPSSGAPPPSSSSSCWRACSCCRRNTRKRRRSSAPPWQRFWRVTLPLLRPSLQTALILRTVLAFEMFAMALALGGRNFPVLVSEAFNWQYGNQDYGVAASYAVLVMAISIAATLIYLVALRVPAEQRA
ncbi:carbohydrate ABC transporter permease [Pseudoroseomonas wenyumeiae]